MCFVKEIIQTFAYKIHFQSKIRTIGVIQTIFCRISSFGLAQHPCISITFVYPTIKTTAATTATTATTIITVTTAGSNTTKALKGQYENQKNIFKIEYGQPLNLTSIRLKISMRFLPIRTESVTIKSSKRFVIYGQGVLRFDLTLRN